MKFCEHKFLQHLFLRIWPEIAKNYNAKRIDFLRSGKNCYRKSINNVLIRKTNVVKIKLILCEKLKKPEVFLIKVFFYLPFDKLYMGIPYSICKVLEWKAY